MPLDTFEDLYRILKESKRISNIEYVVPQSVWIREGLPSNYLAMAVGGDILYRNRLLKYEVRVHEVMHHREQHDLTQSIKQYPDMLSGEIAADIMVMAKINRITPQKLAGRILHRVIGFSDKLKNVKDPTYSIVERFMTAFIIEYGYLPDFRLMASTINKMRKGIHKSKNMQYPDETLIALSTWFKKRPVNKGVNTTPYSVDDYIMRDIPGSTSLGVTHIKSVTKPIISYSNSSQWWNLKRTALYARFLSIRDYSYDNLTPQERVIVDAEYGKKYP